MSLFVKKRRALMLAALISAWTNAQPQQIPKADYLILEDPRSEVGVNAVYRKLYEEKLFVTPGDLARFVQLPGPLAQTEIAASVYEQKQGSRKYLVTVTEPTRRLADCGPAEPGFPQVDPDTIKVRKEDAPIPESTASALHSVWLTMLEHAKPNPCNECSGEATIEIFSAVRADGKLLRALWVYEGEKTGRLANLAVLLVEYCRAPADQRQRLASDLEKKARELQSAAAGK